MGAGVGLWGWVSRLCAWLLGHSSVGAQRRQGNQLGEVGVSLGSLGALFALLGCCQCQRRLQHTNLLYSPCSSFSHLAHEF